MNEILSGGPTLVVLSVFALVLFVAVWAGLGVTRAREDMTERLALYGRGQAVQTARDEELAKPLAQRTVGPAVLKVSSFLKRFTPVGYLQKKERELMLAGYPGNMDAPAFVVVKLLGTIFGLVAGFFLRGFGSDGIVETTLPPGTSSGRVLRLRGQGWPKEKGGRGDQLAEVRLTVPEEPTEEQAALYRRLAELDQAG